MDTKKLPNLPNRSLSSSPRAQSMAYRQTSASDSHDLSLPCQPDSQAARLTPPPNSGYYEVNNLDFYSFGAAQSAYVPSPSIDPLSQEEDQDPRRFDVTPRPSVVDYGPFGGNPDRITGNHPSQIPGRSRKDDPHPLDPAELGSRLFSSNSQRAHSSDAASHRTFGTSSASASVTSLSSVGQHDSRMSDQSASTRHTSAANTDDEDDRRPLDLSSDDDYDDDYYDDDEDDPAYRVEISSAIYEENSPGDRSAFAGGSNFTEQSRIDLSYDKRRGSLPMAIPGASAEWRTDDRGREREDSLITLRRPSRSLDDDLSILNHYSSAAMSGGVGAASTTAEPHAHSVPGSDTDWRHLAQKRRMNSARVSVSTSSTVRDTAHYANITPTTSRVNASSATDGFDPDWLEMMRGGITSVPTSDFVHRSQDLSAGRSSFFGLRRPSMASVITYDDSFLKAVGRWDSQGYGVQRREWTFKRETADGSGPYQASKPTTGRKLAGLLGAKSPVERDRVGLSSVSSSKSITGEEKDKRERERERERRLPSSWKGMPIGAGEVWGNILIGRYEITRTTSTPSDPNKGPQQRLSIIHFSDDWTKLRHKSPPVTVHKHSKAIAYSISRFYRLRVQQPQDDYHFKATSTRDSSHSKPPPSRDGSVTTTKTSTTYARPKGSTTMILLAPRRVQEDYTNTTTTRKLESHGLLDEQGRNPRDKSLTRREKGRDRDKKRQTEDSKKRKKDAAKLEREQVSSSSSIASSSSSLAPSAASLVSQDLTVERQRRRRRSIDSSSEEDNIPHRTPHSETYSTVDPAVIDQLRPNRAHAANDESGLFRRMLRGSKPRTNPISSSGNYNPPWMVMSSRNEQEEQQRMVRNLSSSFAGVGLLPPTHKERSRPNSQKQKRSKDIPGAVDIFDEIEPDTLFMILPLWPGETDPKSRSKTYERPDIPLQDRLFLILSYRTSKQKNPQDGKKVRSPTSSADNRDDRNILLTAFHVSARVVKYEELTGSGMRVPDEGLAVSGPLEEAFMSIPKPDSGMQVIGNCSSRESGVEFDPEGLTCLGLCRMTPPSSDMPNEVPVPIPTPIGRAVIEMAFIGGIALTSFGSIAS